MPALIFNGTELKWMDKSKVVATYPATSGMADFGIGTFQKPSSQCVGESAKDPRVGGPIPEGTYVLQLRFDPNVHAMIADPKICKLRAGGLIQEIPLPEVKNGTGDCGQYWRNWGYHRVRLEPYDTKAKRACKGSRSGFYLHDSSKGYTHGCIEVSQSFFGQLYKYVNSKPKEKLMLLSVDYTNATTTLGATKK